ncbi:polyprenyl synthetase family protein [Streptomyces sp. NPDC058405]|uniref:polyprenyl synthetase family protein n=1 Tax=Streptomyces sp. NPDC058405 TaxID=3346482 RepID=UPI00364F9182
MDVEVPGAVGRVLDGLLHGRLAEAEAIDATFARDVAERLARFTLGGGKRTRSQFLWWGLRSCGDTADVDSALRLAAALELIQTCALVHDDVMDGSPTRRGGRAVHTQIADQYRSVPGRRERESFARSAAILVGDLALAWADDLVADTVLSPEVRRRVYGIWRAMKTEMVAGQYLDLHGKANGSRSTAQAIRTACLKSALYSVERPLAMGAALASADRRTTRALRSAGRCAGIAFQLRDDILGVFGDPARTGKPSGEDIRQGKPTYLVAVARARAEANGDRASATVLESAFGDARLSEDGLARVRSVLLATGARATVEKKIARLMANSTRHLDRGTFEPAALHRLQGLLYAVAGLPPDVRAPSGRVGDGPPASPLLVTSIDAGKP